VIQLVYPPGHLAQCGGMASSAVGCRGQAAKGNILQRSVGEKQQTRQDDFDLGLLGRGSFLPRWCCTAYMYVVDAVEKGLWPERQAPQLGDKCTRSACFRQAMPGSPVFLCRGLENLGQVHFAASLTFRLQQVV